jgi:hypothetical protein
MATLNYNVRLGSGTPGTVCSRLDTIWVAYGDAHVMRCILRSNAPAGVSYDPHHHGHDDGADQLPGCIAPACEQQSCHPVRYCDPKRTHSAAQVV